MHGQEMIWLQPHVVNKTVLEAFVLIGGVVQCRYVREAAAVVTLPNRERESLRTVELLMAQHHAYERFKADLNAAANEWADDNDLCHRYDEFMQQHRFNGRTHDYRAQILSAGFTVMVVFAALDSSKAFGERTLATAFEPQLTALLLFLAVGGIGLAVGPGYADYKAIWDHLDNEQPNP
ncbi:hypothetical protein [Tessaracoccus lubricantis]